MIRLIFTGDVMIGRLVNEFLLATNNYSSIWGNTLDLLKSADLTLINLECALTGNRKKGEKNTPIFFFRSEPENIQSLVDAGIDYASLSNNHVLDYDIQGLTDTINTLKSRNINFAGAGENITNALKPAFISVSRKPRALVRGRPIPYGMGLVLHRMVQGIEPDMSSSFGRGNHGLESAEDVIKIKNLKIKVFSFSDNEPGWEAAENKPGIFFLPIDLNNKKVDDFFNQIQKEKEKGYFIIVSAHWGPNMVRIPSKKHQDFAHALINAGCDIFHGHSSHVFQPIEIYQKKVILYDCGEMIDDYAVDPMLRNDESFIYQVNLEGEEITSLLLYPILINNLQVNLVKDIVAKKISGKMIEICKDFKTKAIFKDDKINIQIN